MSKLNEVLALIVIGSALLLSMLNEVPPERPMTVPPIEAGVVVEPPQPASKLTPMILIASNVLVDLFIAIPFVDFVDVNWRHSTLVR